MRAQSIGRRSWTLVAGWSVAAIASACVTARPWNQVEVTATAYNSVESQTDSRPEEGAWGDSIRPGVRAIAVSSDLLERGLERGTKVRIDGVPGTWVVLDRMAGRHRNRIDIYMDRDVDAARRWGVKEVLIRWAGD